MGLIVRRERERRGNKSPDTIAFLDEIQTCRAADDGDDDDGGEEEVEEEGGEGRRREGENSILAIFNSNHPNEKEGNRRLERRSTSSTATIMPDRRGGTGFIPQLERQSLFQ